MAAIEYRIGDRLVEWKMEDGKLQMGRA